MKKRIGLLIMVLLLTMNVGTLFTNAAYVPTEDVVAPCAMTCTCSGYMVKKSVTRDAWQTIGSVGCTKMNGYYDSKQKRKVRTAYKCSNCGYEMTVETYEYRTYCTH